MKTVATCFLLSIVATLLSSCDVLMEDTQGLADGYRYDQSGAWIPPNTEGWTTSGGTLLAPNTNYRSYPDPDTQNWNGQYYSRPAPQQPMQPYHQSGGYIQEAPR